MLAGPRWIARMMARAVSLATGTVTDRAHCWGPSAGWRSRCRAPGSTPRRARPRNGRAKRCGLTSGEGKDTVSRVWRKVKADWDAWNARALGEEPIVRGGLGRLQRHDLRHLAHRDRGAPPGLPPQMAAQMQGGSRQPR